MASLTKEELKNALINNGIDLPPSSSKKEVFVALYEKHVAPIDEKREFSADEEDEEIIITKKAKPPIYAFDRSAVTAEVDVDSMDDDQLLQSLKENNIEAGPIGNTTRDLYKKKLKEALAGSAELVEEVSVNVTNGSEEGYSDTEPEDSANPIVEEPEEDTGADSTHLSSEDDQPSGLSQPALNTSTSKLTTDLNGSLDLSSSNLNSGSLSGNLDANGSTLRQRFATVDTLDSGVRYTPTARRSIHSYKVTEVTTHHIVKTRDGKETKNVTHTIEKKESFGDDKVPGSEVKSYRVGAWAWRFLKTLSKLVLLALFVAALYYVYTNHLNKGEAKEAIDQIQEAIQNAANKAARVVREALGKEGKASEALDNVEAAGDALNNVEAAEPAGNGLDNVEAAGDATGETAEAPVDSMPMQPGLHV